MYNRCLLSLILGKRDRRFFNLITHFQWKPLYADRNLPGWSISFFYKKQSIQAIYHKNGEIEWVGNPPSAEDEAEMKSMIHELMLFHVYE
jgi:hypothetical protein